MRSDLRVARLEKQVRDLIARFDALVADMKARDLAGHFTVLVEDMAKRKLAERVKVLESKESEPEVK